MLVRVGRAADLQLREPGRGHGRRDHARDPRPRPRLEHAEAAADPRRARLTSRRSTRTCRTCSATTARSSRSGTGRRRSTSSGTPAISRAALMNFLALLGWAPDGETTIMPPDELVRALLARSRRREPGDARLPEARLDERRLPAGAAAGRVRATASSRSSASGLDWPEERVRASVPLVQEKIERLAQYPEFAGFLFERPESAGGDPEILARRGRGARRARAVHRGGDRAGAPRPRRAARPEAAAGVSADPGRGHRLDGLTGPLREHRVPGPRRDARAAQERAGGIGLGRASGSSAR